MSRDATAALLQTVLGIPICPATVQSCCEQMSQALVAPTREVEEAVPNAASIHLDETSWRHGGVMHWLWIGVTNHLALFAVNRRRGKDQLNLWSPQGYSGVLHCDRWRPCSIASGTAVTPSASKAPRSGAPQADPSPERAHTCSRR